jgi:molybdate transport system ATP-binding protein
MDAFGIRELANRSFLHLSSGEQRLILVARAFVKNPDLLILDEPMHGLDLHRQQLVKQVIEDYCKQPSKTLIIVSHYEEELPACIDHRLTLQKGHA